MEKPSVAIVGAGIIGVALARSLSQAGAKVTIFEREHLGAGTSSASFAWVNSNGKNPESYHELNLRGLREHEKLQQTSSSEARWFIQSGTYEWSTDSEKNDRLRKRVQLLTERDYPVHEVSKAELRSRIPEVKIDPRSGTIWSFPQEGYIWPHVLLARLWSEARQLGSELRTGVEAVEITETEKSAQVVLSDGTQWTGDYVVSAAGRWSSRLMKQSGLDFAMIDADQPNKIACGFLGYTNPQYVQLRSNLITPRMNVRPDGGGRLLVQTPDLDHRADPAYQCDPSGLVGQEMTRRLQQVFDTPGPVRIEQLRVGQRSRPADGLPAVGFLPNLKRTYVVAMHSGITLAPLMGDLVTDELLKDSPSELLADYRPDRLVGKTVEDFPAFSTIHFPAAQ